MTMLDPGVNANQLADVSPVDGRKVIHSHHYNVALVRTVLGTEQIDSRSILETAAAELAFQTLRERAKSERWRSGKRWLSEASALFRSSGLGVLELGSLSDEGGEVCVEESHFTEGWVAKYGVSSQPVCSVAAGFLAGALAAAFDKPYKVTETSCVAEGKGQCRFKIVPATGVVPFAEEPVSVGSPLSLPAPVPPAFDEFAVVAALLDVLPSADSEGRIPAFGGTVTRLWADLYNQVSFRFEREVPRVMGNKFANLPSLVLIEAGHTCAYHTFGGIMNSDEWWDRVVPLLQTREDWLHAAIAIINTLGWGSWRVHALVPGQRATIRVYDSYEATGYRQRFGKAEGPKCYFSRGTAAALMNLIYVGDITERPELTASYYNQLFRSPLSFRAAEARCRSMDDPYCELVINPLTAGLNSKLIMMAKGG
jgi:predicted hydrocarbon binding protein